MPSWAGTVPCRAPDRGGVGRSCGPGLRLAHQNSASRGHVKSPTHSQTLSCLLLSRVSSTISLADWQMEGTAVSCQDNPVTVTGGPSEGLNPWRARVGPAYSLLSSGSLFRAPRWPHRESSVCAVKEASSQRSWGGSGPDGG